MFEAVVSAIEVGIYHCIPALGADVCQRRHELPATVVHEVVYSPITADCVLHQCLNLSSEYTQHQNAYRGLHRVALQERWLREVVLQERFH